MPRRGNVPKREILPDPMYNSVLVTKLINGVMLDGKKGVAQKVVYDAFDIIKEKTAEAAARTIEKAMGTPKATNNISVPTNSIAIIWLPLCCSYRLHRYLPLL